MRLGHIDVSYYKGAKVEINSALPCIFCGDIESQKTHDVVCGYCQTIIDSVGERIFLSKQAQQWAAHYASVWMKRAVFADMAQSEQEQCHICSQKVSMDKKDIVSFLLLHGWIKSTDLPYDPSHVNWRDPVNPLSWYTMEDAYDIETGRHVE